MSEHRFWERVDTSRNAAGCWPWLGSTSRRSGYGQVYFAGRSRGAHVVAYLLAKGDIARDLIVLHSRECVTRLCCNPDHLRLGTYRDNASDRDAVGRTARGSRNGRSTKPHRTARGPLSGPSLHPSSYTGERNGRAVLTAADVRAIRDAHATGETGASIARCFGVGKSTVHHILQRDTWKNV